MVTVANRYTIQLQCLASSFDMAWSFILPLLNHILFVFVEEREDFIKMRDLRVLNVSTILIDKE